jgi:predicted O-methyltransferase YrrM
MSSARAFAFRVFRVPVIGRVIGILFRTHIPFSYLGRTVWRAFTWLFCSRELSNFTYPLTQLNREHLAATVAHVAGIEPAAALSYLDELEQDEELKAHIIAGNRANADACVADQNAHFGRRIGWYAFARAMKPRVVIETGVDKGMGACVLAAAVLRNRAEGFEGVYYGTDINPDAGYLFAGRWAEAGSILYGDSLEQLRSLDCEIDLFINDSDHSADYEYREYQQIADQLSAQAVVLGDNSHCSASLHTFSREQGRAFLIFREEPAEHWYAGAGIGISFPATSR